MLKITVDEAEVFDRLAILTCKMARVRNGAELDALSSQYKLLLSEVVSQVGDAALNFMQTDDYRSLINLHSDIFSVVELASRNQCSASAVHEMNMLRHRMKREIQKKYFNSQLQEIKLT